jgi:hypothetical protein
MLKNIITLVLKIFLITFIGIILMKFIIPVLGIPNPIINTLLNLILIGVLIYFLFKKRRPNPIDNNINSNQTK